MVWLHDLFVWFDRSGMTTTGCSGRCLSICWPAWNTTSMESRWTAWHIHSVYQAEWTVRDCFTSNMSINCCFFLICRMQEALNYLSHAYETNNTLIVKGEKRGMDRSLIAVYRRKCLMVSQWGFLFELKKILIGKASMSRIKTSILKEECRFLRRSQAYQESSSGNHHHDIYDFWTENVF